MTTSTPADRWALCFTAAQARDLMTGGLVSVRGSATLDEAIRLMTERGLSAVPVINQAGRPCGVLSRTDVLVHSRETSHSVARGAAEGAARVSDHMTPAIFTVPLEMPARDVIRHMVQMNVHQLFVTDKDDSLLGVINALDVLRHAEL
jgi:predicted transcriptional regulator